MSLVQFQANSLARAANLQSWSLYHDTNNGHNGTNAPVAGPFPQGHFFSPPSYHGSFVPAAVQETLAAVGENFPDAGDFLLGAVTGA
jgi:hypothetical protein